MQNKAFFTPLPPQIQSDNIDQPDSFNFEKINDRQNFEESLPFFGDISYNKSFEKDKDLIVKIWELSKSTHELTNQIEGINNNKNLKLKSQRVRYYKMYNEINDILSNYHLELLNVFINDDDDLIFEIKQGTLDLRIQRNNNEDLFLPVITYFKNDVFGPVLQSNIEDIISKIIELLEEQG